MKLASLLLRLAMKLNGGGQGKHPIETSLSTNSKLSCSFWGESLRCAELGFCGHLGC